MFKRVKLTFEEKVKIHELTRARDVPSMGPPRAIRGPELHILTFSSKVNFGRMNMQKRLL